MANYNISIDTSNFKPFTYEQKIAPLLLYNKDYDALQDRMDKLQEKYEDVPRTGEADVDAQIDSYLENQQSVFNDFIKYGLTKPGIRSRFSQLKGEAASTLKPIIKAVQTRDEIRKQMQAIQSNDPTAILAPEPTIGEILRGRKPELGYRSGKQIQAEAAAVSQGVQNLNYSAPEKVGSIANQYFILKEGGANQQQIVETLMDGVPAQDIDKQSTAIRMAASLYNKYIAYNDTPSNKRKIWQNVVQGFIMGIQAPKYNTVANQGYLSPLQEAQYKGQLLENYAKGRENDARDANNSWGQSNDGQQHLIAAGGKNWVVRNGILVDPSNNKPATSTEIEEIRKTNPEMIDKIYGKKEEKLPSVQDLQKEAEERKEKDKENNTGGQGGKQNNNRSANTGNTGSNTSNNTNNRNNSNTNHAQGTQNTRSNNSNNNRNNSNTSSTSTNSSTVSKNREVEKFAEMISGGYI